MFCHGRAHNRSRARSFRTCGTGGSRHELHASHRHGGCRSRTFSRHSDYKNNNAQKSVVHAHVFLHGALCGERRAHRIGQRVVLAAFVRFGRCNDGTHNRAFHNGARRRYSDDYRRQGRERKQLRSHSALLDRTYACRDDSLAYGKRRAFLHASRLFRGRRSARCSGAQCSKCFSRSGS